MSDPRLEELFERFRRHADVDALGQVFDATAPALRRVARHLTRDRAEADDLVQAAFLTAIEKRATFDATRELKAWLTGILLREAALARRARTRVVEPDRLEARASEDPHDAAAAQEINEVLTAALARLDPSDRDVLIPLLLDGRRAVEIARELGRRPDTVHMRIHRGLERLRRLLPAGIASIAALVTVARARGLAAVRAEVLKHARLELAPSASAAVGLTTVGVLMSLKKAAVLVCVAVVLVLGARYATTYADRGGTKSPVASAGIALDAPIDAVQAPRDERARSAAAQLATVESPAAVVSSELELEIVRDDGSAVAGAPVALVDAGGILRTARTDPSGTCSFAAGLGAGDLYVRDERAFPEHFTIELAAGRRTIVVAKGSELAGRLTLVGDGSVAGIDLELTTDSAPAGIARATEDVFRALGLYESWSTLVARTTTDDEGRFRFRAPDASWSGLLRLPREIVFVGSARSTSANELVLRGPRPDLEAQIAYGRRVTGRLVDADGVALCDAILDCLVKCDGTHTRTRVRSGSGGRFAIALGDAVEVAELQLVSIQAPDGRVAHAARSSHWDGPADLYDAGDIVCAFPAARSLDVRVTGPDGVPITGARVAVGLDVVTTDEGGVARFGAVPEVANEVRVVAPGWAIATAVMSAESKSPIEVVLAPTNRLTIALPHAVGGRWDLNVDLVCRSIPIGTRPMDGTQLRVVHGSESYSAHQTEPREIRATFGVAEDGMLVLEQLVTGVPLQIELIARAARSGKKEVWSSTTIDALGPAEQRRIDLVIDEGRARSLHVLRVHVVDEHGRPLDLAGLDTEIGAGGYSAVTDMTGSAHVDVLGSDETDVEVSKRGYQPFCVHDWDLTSDRVLEATLVRGRDLRVEIVETRGRPISGAQLRADVMPRAIAEQAPGVYVLEDASEGPLRIVVDFAGARYEHLHPAPGDVARIVLPEHGRLEVAWIPTAVRSGANALRLALIPVGSAGGAQTSKVVCDRDGALAFDAVLPGEYSIRFEAPPSGADDPIFAPLGDSRRITVVAGETVRVEL